MINIKAVVSSGCTATSAGRQGGGRQASLTGRQSAATTAATGPVPSNTREMENLIKGTKCLSCPNKRFSALMILCYYYVPYCETSDETDTLSLETMLSSISNKR